MDWAKKNYDTLVLGVCMSLLVLNAAYLYFESSAFTDSLPTASTSTPNKSLATSPDTQSIEEARSITEKPVFWNEKSSSNNERGNLLVSRIYILKEDKLIDPIEGEEQLHPPITNAWLISFGIDYAVANVKDLDPDQDGFTNLEEYNYKTDPKNKNSHPSRIKTKFHFVKFEQKPFPIIFKGDAGDEGTDLQFSKAKFVPSYPPPPVNPDTVLGKIDLDGVKYVVTSYKKKEYPVDLPDGERNKYDEVLTDIKAKIDQDSELKQISADKNKAAETLKKSETELAEKKSTSSKDSIKEMEEKVKRAKSRIVDLIKSYDKSYDEKIKASWHEFAPSFEKYLDTPKKDFSEVVLKNILTGESITLIKDSPIPDPTSVGVFFDVISNEHIRRKKGEEFTLKPDDKTQFKLIDISSAEAKIQDVATGDITSLTKSSSPAP